MFTSATFLHSFTTETHVARELEALDHAVWRFQEPGGGGNTATLRALERVVDEHEAELLLWTRTWGLPSEATGMWRRLESRGVKTASFHLDLYVGLPREQALHRGDPFWTTGFVFTPDGSEQATAVFRELGINHHWSPPAVVSDEVASRMPGSYRAEFAYDVCFVGSPGEAYHPEWAWRGMLLDWLERTYGQREMGYRRFGLELSAPRPQPTRGPGPRLLGPRATERPAMRGQRLNDLFASAKVVIGDSLCLPGRRDYFSDRPFETVGRGGFLIMSSAPGLDAFLTDRQHLVYYDVGDLDGLRARIETALDFPDLRERIQRCGSAHVEAHHTYKHRLARVIETVQAG